MRIFEQLRSAVFPEPDETENAGEKNGGSSRKNASSASSLTLVARQPIFTRLGVTWGYELLCCPKEPLLSGDDSEAVAAIAGLSDSFAMMLPSLEPEQFLCIKLGDAFLKRDVPHMLPPAACCVEVLPGNSERDEILGILQKLRGEGYKIAVQYDSGDPAVPELLKVADIVKVDVQRLSSWRIIPLVADIPLRSEQLLVAEKVEDAALMRFCEKLGFNMFQGAYFSRPEFFEGKKLTSGQKVKLRLLSELSTEKFDIRSVAGIISGDLSITYRLMRYLNSLYFSLPNKVKSVEHGISLLGMERLRSWLSVVLLSDISSNPMARNIVAGAALRGKFLEILARETGGSHPEPDSLFLLGMFSLLDALLGLPLSEVLRDVPLDDELLRGLRQREGRYALWLEFVLAYEKGDCSKVVLLSRALGLKRKSVVPAYFQALEWSRFALA